MKKYYFITLVVILLCGLIFSGCTKTSTTTTTKVSTATSTATSTTTSTTTGPQTGGILKIITTIVFSNLGYPPMGFGDQIYAEPAIETLVTLDSEGKGEIVPQLATNWQYSADYKSLTFTLRKGVKFHDGTDFNSQAAKFNLDMIKASGQGLLSSVESVDAVDDYTIRLNLSAYEPSLLLDFTSGRNSMMVSPTAIKSMSQEESMTHPVGTGPFKFASYQRSVSLKYEKFADYWQKGKPYLDGIELVFIADKVTALASFQAGEGQALRSPSSKDAANLEATGKFKIYRTAAAVFGLAFDSANSDSPFYDLKLRQAVCYATDIEAINKAVGYGLPMTNQFATTDAWYYNPTVVGYPYDVKKAKEILAQTDNPNGFSTNIYYENVAGIDTMCLSVQSYLRDVGIDAKLVPQERAAFIQTRTGGWDNGLVWFSITGGGSSDPGSRLVAAISSKGINYKSILVPADYDTKLFQAMTEPDKAKRTALCQELEKMIIDTYCLAIPCYVLGSFTATNLQLHDFNFNNYGPAIWDPENAWLSK